MFSSKFKPSIFVITFLSIYFIIPLIYAGSDFPSISPESIISTYGKPDIIDSTEYDKPRPLMVTKWLIYKKEKVKFWFMADAPMGSPPPYKNWKLIGVTDPRNDNLLDSLEPQELKKRMSRRLRNN